eukprot:tig00020629_g12384.t1
MSSAAERAPLLPTDAGASSASEALELSPLAVFGNLVRSFTGAGVLALPYAVSRFGIIPGLLGFVFLAAICRVSCRMLLASRKEAGIQGEDCFAEIGREAYGAVGRSAVLFAVVAGLWGVLVSFNLVIAHTLATVFPQLSVRGWLAAVCPLLILLNVSNSRRVLVVASALGNVVLFASCAAVLAAGYEESQSRGIALGCPVLEAVVRPRPFVLKILERDLRSPSPLPPTPHLPLPTFPRVPTTPGRVLAFYASFSVAAYAAFGSATQQIVVLNITEGYIAAAVQLSMSAVVALTTPIVRPAPH